MRNFHQAMSNWRAGTHRRPTWRKRGRHEGRGRLGRARDVPEAKSYRVTLDSAGRWHLAVAAIPDQRAGPGDGSVVGIERGVTVALALSDGSVHQAPKPRDTTRLQRRVCRAKRGSTRRAKVKARLARLQARNVDLNAACTIAAGHTVTTCGGSPWGGPVHRESQHAPSQVV